MHPKVLITGASGFLGRVIASKLVDSGWYEVHTTSTGRLEVQGAIHHRADMLDPMQVTELVRRVRPEHLIHLAWETRHDVYLESVDNLSWLAHGMTLLREFAENGGQRLISAGTCMEYDLSYGVLREDLTPASNNNLYGITKRNFYNVARRFCEANGVSYACGRILFMYGQRDKPSRAVPYAINAFLSGKPATCNAADAFRDYMHVEDGADGFIALMRSGLAGAVNIASGLPVSMGEIFTEIATQLDSLGALTLNSMKSGDRLIVADVGKMKESLGFSPAISLREGIRRTIQWHRETSRG